MKLFIAFTAVMFTMLAASTHAAEPTKAEVEAYLLQIADSHSTLYKVGERFGKTLGPLLQGNEPDSREVHRAYRDVAQTLGRVRRDVKGWSVPDSVTARKLAAANDEFMEYQLKATLEWLPKMIDIMEDETSTIEARGKKVLAELESGGAEESAVGTKVREAYVELATEFEVSE